MDCNLDCADEWGRIVVGGRAGGGLNTGGGGKAMRWAGAGLIAVVLALTGCKSTAPKPSDKKDAAASTASRPKGKGSVPPWLEESMAKLPGAGTAVPKAGSWANPKDPNFDVARESRGLLAGRVLDPTGHPAKNVFIRIEPVDATPKEKGGAVVGILANDDGYFMAKDLAPGRAYNLTAQAQAEGKTLYGVVQAKTPQPNLTIPLRDDLPTPQPGGPPAGPSGGNPGGLPPAAPSSEQPSTPGSIPPPSNELIPPMGLAPLPPSSIRPADGAWAPGGSAATKSIPATIAPTPTSTPTPGATPTPTPLPSPADPRPAAPSRPENVADGPPSPWRPPAASLPGPPVPTLPNLPATNPAPPAVPVPPEKKSSRPVPPSANFALIDGLGRPWNFATSRYGSLVLLEFMTTSCVPCQRAIPILVDLQGRYGAHGLQLVGVVCDDTPQQERVAQASKYQRDHNLNYALYVEPGPEPGSVRDRFEIQSYPTVLLLDAVGNVVWRGHPSNRAALESAIKRHLEK